DRAAVDEELAEAVRRDDREERGADRDEQMRAQSRLALAQLALQSYGAAEHGGDDEPQQDLGPAERRDRAEHVKQGGPRRPRPARRRSRRRRRPRARAARRASR